MIGHITLPHRGYLFVENKVFPPMMPHSGYLFCSLKAITLPELRTIFWARTLVKEEIKKRS
jgi:hypothetical protein